jgi:hypothetical protein
MLTLPDGVVMRMTPGMQRPRATFWADVHFLMIAVRHLDLTQQNLWPRRIAVGQGVDREGGCTEKICLSTVGRRNRAKALEALSGQARPGRKPYAGSVRARRPRRSQNRADPLSVVDLAADIRRVESELI